MIKWREKKIGGGRCADNKIIMSIVDKTYHGTKIFLIWFLFLFNTFLYLSNFSIDFRVMNLISTQKKSAPSEVASIIGQLSLPYTQCMEPN